MTTYAPQIATLPAEVRASLLWWAASEPAEEVCGVIINGRPIRLSNVAEDPRNFFQIDDQELLSIYEQGVPTAVWHSHTNGDPLPSTADEDGTPPGMTMLIVAAGEVYAYEVE